MKIVHYQEVTSTPVNIEGAKNVNIRWLISKEDGAENFAMRYFELICYVAADSSLNNQILTYKRISAFCVLRFLIPIKSSTQSIMG